MGGYGLVGVITELELDMVPNTLLEPKFERMRGHQLGKRFAEDIANDPSIQNGLWAHGCIARPLLKRLFAHHLSRRLRPVEHSSGRQFRFHEPRRARYLPRLTWI